MKKVLQIKGYENVNYASFGFGFISLYKKKADVAFGEIINKKMVLSPTGELVKNIWLDLPKHFKNLEMLEYQITPHEIMGIVKRKNVELVDIVDLFKSQVEEKTNSFENFWASQNKKQAITTKLYHDNCTKFIKESVSSWKPKAPSLQPKTKKLNWWQKIIYKIKKIFKK